MRLRTTLLTTAAVASALVLSAFVAGGSATIIEKRSRMAVRVALESAGVNWVRAEADGLQVILLGTAPSEAARFRAITIAGTVVDSARIVDSTDVEGAAAIAPPEFSLQMLRNDDGISLIGLVPADTDRKALIDGLQTALGDQGTVTDMLERADYPVPAGWQMALDFAVETLKTLPRAKISVDPGRVEVQAITDSPAEKTRIETTLARRRPVELKLTSDISAPRPVITPFTLRFLIDSVGPRFDACSADTTRARDRILAAARAAGAKGAQGCTVGMGTPSPQWADAVVMGINALKEIGAGTITFSDGDIALSANEGTDPAVFDKVVGELESNLPEVFSLKTELQRKADKAGARPEFSALLGEDGKVELRGRVTNERGREAVESFARARFGAKAVYGATRIDGELPQGWPVRTLAALEALDSLAQGSVTVTPDLVTVKGVTGDAQASDTISRVLTQRLGEGARIALDVRYDRRLDPVLGLPDGPECVRRLNAVLAEQKISFEPGSAVIAAAGEKPIEALVKAMKDCQDFRMEIAGHTDSQGREEMNQQLSQDRALAVLHALRDRRVLTENLVAKGYGESQPIADNGTENGREANRRIEFVLLDATPVETEGAPLPAPEAAPVTAPEEHAAQLPPEAAAATPEAAQEVPAEDMAPDLSPLDSPDFSGNEGPMEDATGEPLAGMGEEPLPEATPPAETDATAPDATAAPTEATPAEAPAPDVATAPPDQPAPAAAEPAAPAEPAAETAAPPTVSPEVAAAQDPTIEIPVAPAKDSPGTPKPRPKGLKTDQN
ncbi:OmpA family protein [Paenirhodobacter hankyongi]|uniref:OmpA family protein n=1 Tax=Paenirhodobacter hankyongi TaxID=2294033 RepID=A0A421BPA8_9RHOB|nr:OmpA family protein [Sinirhodobacter hankyongi]RLL64701.1 OmpA family protein [Sinirhodobacter hankyongi]